MGLDGDTNLLMFRFAVGFCIFECGFNRITVLCSWTSDLELERERW